MLAGSHHEYAILLRVRHFRRSDHQITNYILNLSWSKVQTLIFSTSNKFGWSQGPPTGNEILISGHMLSSTFSRLGASITTATVGKIVLKK